MVKTVDDKEDGEKDREVEIPSVGKGKCNRLLKFKPPIPQELPHLHINESKLTQQPSQSENSCLGARSNTNRRL